MNSKALSIIKNLSYTISSNLLSLLVSTLVVLIVPKLIGVADYGYWQLYTFYTAYVGFFHFGWNDGIYLRYGGEKYKDLDKRLFFSQFYMALIFQMVIALVIFLVNITFIDDQNRAFVGQMTAISLILNNMRYMLLYILQATNRIKSYAQITIMDRAIYVGIIITLVIVGFKDYQFMIIADLIGKALSFSYAVYCCKDIVIRKATDFYFSIQEMILNVNVGIKLMLSNIASKFVIGAVRLGVERSWDIETFGKISLTLSISNMVMLFINAIGIVIFPVLRRTDEKKLPDIYATIRDVLMLVALGVLIGYYPLKSVLVFWLPEYAVSLKYMAILFPIVVFEGKMSLLINTYLKVLRKEKTILFINVITVIVSIIITLFTAFLLKNLDITILSIVVILAFRSIMAELLLSKVIEIIVLKDIVLELIVTALFIITAWNFNSFLATILYLLVYMVYLILKRKSIRSSFKNMRALLINK